MTHQPAWMLPNPVFSACVQSYPERPHIDPAETPWTREELDGRIEYWMNYLQAQLGY